MATGLEIYTSIMHFLTIVTIFRDYIYTIKKLAACIIILRQVLVIPVKKRSNRWVQ